MFIVLLAMQPSLPTLTLLTALLGLAYGWRISAGDPMAPVVLVACNATLIVFTSSLLSDTGTLSVWVTRLTQFVVGGRFRHRHDDPAVARICTDCRFARRDPMSPARRSTHGVYQIGEV